MDNGLLFHLLIKFFIPRNYLIMKKGFLSVQGGDVCWGRGKTKYSMINGMNYIFPVNLCCDSSFSCTSPVFNRKHGPYVAVGLQRRNK